MDGWIGGSASYQSGRKKDESKWTHRWNSGRWWIGRPAAGSLWSRRTDDHPPVRAPARKRWRHGPRTEEGSLSLELSLSLSLAFCDVLVWALRRARYLLANGIRLALVVLVRRAGPAEFVLLLLLTPPWSRFSLSLSISLSFSLSLSPSLSCFSVSMQNDPILVFPTVVVIIIIIIDSKQSSGYAIPAVNCVSSSGINACLEAARRNDAPVIIQFSSGGSQFYAGKGLDNTNFRAAIAGAVSGAFHVRTLAEQYGIPVILHTDHCSKKLLPWVDGMLAASERYYQTHGEPLFSSHMIDLSEEPIEENLDVCKGYLQRMSKVGILLEMELGITGGEEDGVGTFFMCRMWYYALAFWIQTTPT